MAKTVNNIDVIVKYIDNATAGIKKTAREMETFAEKSRGAFQKMAGFGAVAFGGITVAGKSYLDMGADLELTLKKANTVFGEHIDLVNEVAKQTATSMGLTRIEYIKASAGLQDLLVPMGFARDEAWEMTKKTMGLTGALAEWSAGTYDASQVSQILTKAMLGETDQLKGLGIQLDISSTEYNERIKKVMEDTGATKEQARALDIQRQIFEKSTDAQKAFTEGSGSLARQKAELFVKLRDVNETIATAMIPLFYELLNVVEPIIKKTTDWIKENEDLIPNIVKITTVGVGLITVLGGIGLAISPVITIITSLIAIVKSLGIALKFLTANPIGMVITALGLLAWGVYEVWRNWETIKPKLIAFWEEVNGRIKKTIDGIGGFFTNLVDSAYDWGIGLLSNFLEGIKNFKGKVVEGVKGVANDIKGYLGFGSPTELGPCSNADKWMPNLINMMTDGLKQGSSKIATSAEKIALKIEETMGGVEVDKLIDKIEEIGRSAVNMNDEINFSLKEHQDNIKSLSNEYNELLKAKTKVFNDIDETSAGGQMEVAQRFLEIEKELADIDKEIKEGAGDLTNEKLQELTAVKQKLETEKELAEQYSNEKDIQEARRLANRTETEAIIERISIKIQEHEAEKMRILELLTEKRKQINDERKTYKSLLEEKKKLDTAYFDFFEERIEKQKNTIESSIELMKQLNDLARVETAPAMTQAPAPSTSTSQNNNININVVNNGQTSETGIISLLTNKINEILSNQAKKYNLGVK